jgi:Amt family ammonium transporter
MHSGFSLVEAGSVGANTVTNILFKNILTVMISIVMWWSFGYWVAFGSVEGGGKDSASEIGISGFFMQNNFPICNYAFWFFQWTFSATTGTIVSGAMAGRTQLFGYSVYCIFMIGFIYPLVVHWTWSADAWLWAGSSDDVGYRDFAGSGIVHACGGTAALMGAIIVGPRYKSEKEKVQFALELQPHSLPMVVLGCLMLMFGFFAFNGGSQLTMDSTDDAQAMAVAVVNTAMSAAGGGFASMLVNKYVDGHFQLLYTCNGMLAGMVAVCAGANVYAPWAALVVGIVGGAAYFGWSTMLKRLNIDDAIDAIPVHLGGGIWGVIAVPLFRKVDSVLYDGSKTAFQTLGWQLGGVITIVVFTAVCTGTLFYLLKLGGKLRIDDAIIQSGIDAHEHAESAYVGFNKPQHLGGAQHRPRTEEDPLPTTTPSKSELKQVKPVGIQSIAV